MFTESSSVLRVYNENFQVAHTKIIKSTIPQKGGHGLRPSLEIAEDRIYLGNNGEHTAEVYIYER